MSILRWSLLLVSVYILLISATNNNNMSIIFMSLNMSQKIRILSLKKYKHNITEKYYFLIYI